MKKQVLSFTLTLIFVLALMPLTALAAVPPGCPDDGQGMDAIWGNKHMEMGKQLTEYAVEKGWSGRARQPQGWGDYIKFSGDITIRNHTNVEDGQWWQLQFELIDDTFTAVLKLYYSPGSAIGTVISEKSVGSGNLVLDELKAVVDNCTAEIGNIVPEATVSNAPSAWAAEQVRAAIEANLVPESLQSKYTQATTRAEFCALAVALYETVSNAEITERSTFSDTADINVEKMAALGVVTGIGDNRFSPDRALTRQEAATMLSRLAAAIGKPLIGKAPAFADHASIASWAADAVGQMQATGIMGGVGDNTFSPQGAYTREQSIVTILRLFDMIDSTNGLISGLTAAPPETEKPEATPEPTPSESTDSFDWVDIATTYDSILRPYAESLGFECEYRQATDAVNGGTFYFLYFTRGEVRITVAPQPASDCYTYMVGKPDDSVAQSRIEENAPLQSCTNTSAIKDVLKSAS